MKKLPRLHVDEGKNAGKDDAVQEALEAAKAQEAPPEAKASNQKRLTIDMRADLHRRFKLRCVEDGVQMADVIRDLIERHLASPGQ